MWTEERDDDDHPPRGVYVDGAWGRTANPNTADGELQNIAAFAGAITRLHGPRKAVVRIVVWLILLGFLTSVVVGVVTTL